MTENEWEGDQQAILNKRWLLREDILTATKEQREMAKGRGKTRKTWGGTIKSVGKWYKGGKKKQ